LRRSFFRSASDAGSSSPVAVLMVVLLTLGFEGLLFGSQVASASFPEMSKSADANCSDNNGLSFIGCLIGNAWAFVVNVFKVIFGAIAFFFNLVSVNIPGAPWFVRLFIGGAIGGALIWGIAALFRGGGGS
jgi:hypothetical protein